MRIVIGEGSCGIAAGAEKVRQELLKHDLGTASLDIAGCIGMCYLEPIVDIYDGDKLINRLVKVQPSDAQAIAEYAVSGDESKIEKLKVSAEDSEFLSKQTRIALRRCGIINPEEIDAFINADGYTALKKCLTELTPEQVIEIIKVSGLAGRGGAGFPTWFKWNAARQSAGDEKYLICNADEGDPGAFMDRAVIESDPHTLIEGMLIGAYALGATGAIMGSGGMVVMDEDTCMVGMAKFFLDFTAKESCGKCIHCRIGTKRMLEILERITKGQGKNGDIELLEELCYSIKDGALCGLGQTAPNPVLTTIKYFRNEYEAHINEKKCPAGECSDLIEYKIIEDKCKGCTLCARNCPVNAIEGSVKVPHKIDITKCIKCGKCYSSCKFGAIIKA